MGVLISLTDKEVDGLRRIAKDFGTDIKGALSKLISSHVKKPSKINNDDWTDIVNSYVSGKTRVHKDEIYDNCLFILGKDRHNGTSARLKAVMMKLGWQERQSWTKADRGRRFFYKDEG